MKINKNDVIRLLIVIVLGIGLSLLAIMSKHEDELEAIGLIREIEKLQIENEVNEMQHKIDSLEALRDLSWENIDKWMDYFGVEHKEVAMQQIFLETGNLSSAICMENNNLFGMRHPRVRETTSLGVNRGHAKYSHWIESIRDYVAKLKYIKRNYTFA
jgi:uncharacterized FlgJ-related protein